MKYTAQHSKSQLTT